MERPSVVYGRCYFGQEIIRNVDNQRPPNETITQFSRSEMSGHSRQTYNETVTDESPPTHLIEPRHRDFTGVSVGPSSGRSVGVSRYIHSNVDDDEYYEAGPGPSYGSRTWNHNGYEHPPFASRHRDSGHQQGSIAAGRGIHYSVVDNGNYAASFDLGHRNHSLGYAQPPFGTRHQVINGRNNIGPVYNNVFVDDDRYRESGPCSSSRTWNYHGNGHSQPPFQARHRDLSCQPAQASTGARRGIHYNVDDNRNYASSFESGNRKHHGHAQPPYGSDHRDFRSQAINERNNISTAYDNVTTNDHVDESRSTDYERNKLIKRITTYYTVLSDYWENIDLFKKNDWVTVSFIFCNGMKIFQAEMTCPICFGKVSPQNKEKEAGRVAKWDLSGVKRHLIGVHKVEANAFVGVTVNKERIIGQIANSKETTELYEAKEETTEPTEEAIDLCAKNKETIVLTASTEKTNDTLEKQEEHVVKISAEDGIEKSVSFVVKNKPSDEKIGKLESQKELGSEEAEKLSGAKEFVSYMSLGASSNSSISPSNSDADSNNRSDSETATKEDRGTKKPKCIMKKRHSTRTRSKRQRSAKKRKLSSSSESEQEIPDWKKRGVTFGWVKLTPVSRFQPAFIFPVNKNEKKRSAQYIQAKGTLSDYKHPVESIASAAEVEQIQKSKKSSSYLSAIKKFNALNNTNF